MKQLSLFTESVRDICAGRHRGNPQSVAAHKKIAETLPTARAEVYAMITLAGASGLTADELSANTGIPVNALSGRFTELKKDGLIHKIGTRPTRSGGVAAAYVAKTNHAS